MEQIVPQTQTELENEGWQFGKETLPPELPVMYVQHTGEVQEGDISEIMAAARDNRPFYAVVIDGRPTAEPIYSRVTMWRFTATHFTLYYWGYDQKLLNVRFPLV